MTAADRLAETAGNVSVKVYLNGSIVEERDAHISVLDRGFL